VRLFSPANILILIGYTTVFGGVFAQEVKMRYLEKGRKGEYRVQKPRSAISTELLNGKIESRFRKAYQDMMESIENDDWTKK